MRALPGSMLQGRYCASSLIAPPSLLPCLVVLIVRIDVLFRFLSCPRVRDDDSFGARFLGPQIAVAFSLSPRTRERFCRRFRVTCRCHCPTARRRHLLRAGKTVQRVLRRSGGGGSQFTLDARVSLRRVNKSILNSCRFTRQYWSGPVVQKSRIMHEIIDPCLKGFILCIIEVQKWRLKWLSLGMPASAPMASP